MTTQSVHDMALPELPLDLADLSLNPQPYIEAARSQHPWLAKCRIGYLVHGYRAIKDLLPLDDKLRPGFDGVVGIYGGKGTEWGRFQEEQILGRSGADHLRIRGSAEEAFIPRNVKNYRPLIRRVAAQLLDEWVPKGQFDFTVFASQYPVTILCALLGTSAEPIPRLRESLETQALVGSMDPKLLPALQAAYEVLSTFVDGLIVDREKSGVVEEGGLLDRLIAAKRAGELSETELRDLLVVLFVAGYGTSKTMLSVTMHMMLTHPDAWRRCADDIGFCTKVAEEIFRHTAITNPPRIVAEEFEYDGVRFPKDTMLIFLVSKSGRDPSVFEDPMEFRADRVHTHRHMGFGRGAHICLGQHLARVQIVEGIHLIAQRLTNPRLVGEVKWRPFIAGGGVASLPITFDAKPARTPLPDVAAPGDEPGKCPVSH